MKLEQRECTTHTQKEKERKESLRLCRAFENDDVSQAHQHIAHYNHTHTDTRTGDGGLGRIKTMCSFGLLVLLLARLWFKVSKPTKACSWSATNVSMNQYLGLFGSGVLRVKICVPFKDAYWRNAVEDWNRQHLVNGGFDVLSHVAGAIQGIPNISFTFTFLSNHHRKIYTFAEWHKQIVFNKFSTFVQGVVWWNKIICNMQSSSDIIFCQVSDINEAWLPMGVFMSILI